MGVDFLDRRVLAKRVVDRRKPASGHESQLRQGVASGHPQGRSAAKEPQSGLTRRNPLTFDPTCCGFSHSLFAIYARFYAAVNNRPCVPLRVVRKPALLSLAVTAIHHGIGSFRIPGLTDGPLSLYRRRVPHWCRNRDVQLSKRSGQGRSSASGPRRLLQPAAQRIDRC